MNVMFLEEHLYNGMSAEDRAKLNDSSVNFDMIIFITLADKWNIGYNQEYKQYRSRKELSNALIGLTREQATEEFQAYVDWKKSHVQA